jgi:hypothetical protein
MLNLDALDTVIAVLVVLLVLSLVVQAIQSALKKLFKIKSRQIEESLLDLLKNVLETSAGPESSNPSTGKAAKRRRLPTLVILPTVKSPSGKAPKQVKPLFDAIIDEFSKIGRVAASGNTILESISKEDLMKVLRKVGVDKLYPEFSNKFKLALGDFKELKKAINAVKTENLSGETSAKFAKIQEALNPLFNDIERFFKTDGTSGGASSNKDLLLADILSLREIQPGHVLDILGEVQKKVREELDKDPNKESIKALDNNLRKIADVFTKLHQKVDEVIAPLHTKLMDIERWYDTVMTSFEERYTRGMKTYAFVIGLVVCVWLNANIFNIYQDISANADNRAAIVSAGQAALQTYEEKLAAPDIIQNQDAQKELKNLIKTKKEEIKKASDEYAKFGFKTWKEECESYSKLIDGWAKVQHVLMMVLGWLVMAALLSLGAPFWHDALETLFGVKNLVRRRGDIKSAESAGSGGQGRT